MSQVIGVAKLFVWLIVVVTKAFRGGQRQQVLVIVYLA
jgi:hypothetical protein